MLSEGSEITLVDATGLACPMPLLQAKLAMNTLLPGALLKVLADDPASQRDFQKFAELSGHEMIHKTAANGQFEYLLRKSSD